MPGLSDLTGRNGMLEQLLLWQVAGQVISALLSPAWAALQQDALAKHPDMVLTPDIAAQLAVRHLAAEAEMAAEAGKSGIDSTRFGLLKQLATIRISPADMAEAVLRSYVTEAEAIAESTPQGIDAARFKILTDLAGDGIGPQQAAEALRRKLIPATGKGIGSISYEQAIAESRLHNKWGPVLAELERAILSPPDAAEAVVRGFIDLGAGVAVAALSGVDRATFETMVHLAGDAPGPQQLAEALRRGAIPYDSGSPERPGFIQGIREGRLADMWAPVIEALARIWPTPVDALDAALKGQLSQDDARKMYELLGGDIQFYPWLFNSQGESPTPLELIEMANRDYIPWTGLGPDVVSYEQGFKEGRWRDKWAPVYKRFADYLPPVETVLTLLSHGSLDNATAAGFLAKQGMTPELIKAYLDEAHTVALSDYRGATVSAVLDSYYAQLITADDAANILEALHVTPQAVELLLAYQDVKRAFSQVNSAVTRVRTLYAARKITQATAKDSLIALGIPLNTVQQVIATWEIENSIQVKVLTEAQIADAFEAQLLSQDEALTELENIGYTPFDAWVILSIKAKTPLPGKPATGPAVPQNQVIPGTT